jgi:hypothetical protein
MALAYYNDFHGRMLLRVLSAVFFFDRFHRPDFLCFELGLLFDGTGK